MIGRLCVVAAVVMAGLPALAAGLLPAGEGYRILPVEIVDDRVFLPARVGPIEGRMMFDTGTADPVFLNRDFAVLGPGIEVARGHAASGQSIVVETHPWPGEVVIGGIALPPAEAVPSGNLGFVQAELMPDFLGFAGLALVAGQAFALDPAAGRIVLFRAAPGLDAAAVAARAEVVLAPGALPRASARIGEVALALEFDTGDRGTLYLSETTRAALVAEGHLGRSSDGWRVMGVSFGGGRVDPFPVNLVEAGGPEDFRADPSGDALRLGGSFLGRYPTLWDLENGAISVLRSTAALPR